MRTHDRVFKGIADAGADVTVLGEEEIPLEWETMRGEKLSHSLCGCLPIMLSPGPPPPEDTPPTRQLQDLILKDPPPSRRQQKRRRPVPLPTPGDMGGS